MHDVLGSHLTDINMLVNKIVVNANEIIPGQILKLKILSDSALHALRSQLREEDQKEILRVSFLDGLRLILKKRYKNVGRNVKFEWDPKWNETSIRLLDKENAHALYMIFTEITTNDLKYSNGVSTWKLSIEPQVFWFHFSSGRNINTSLMNPESADSKEEENGMGEISIKVRAEGLGGSLSIVKNPYSIQLIIPTKLFEW
jgi:signal transduction histidine kinase